MSVVYNCHIPEVMGYPERGYCFRRGADVFLMWDGYLHELMRAMWAVYGYEFDPERPEEPHLDQVPLLRAWNNGCLAANGRVPVGEPEALARALGTAVPALQRSGQALAGAREHGAALVTFLTEAARTGQPVSIEEWWG